MLPQIKTILYTTALGSHTRPVFRFAVGLARRHNARIVLLHVVEPLNNSVRFLMESYLSPEKAQELHHEATRGVLEKFHKRLEAFCAEELGATSPRPRLVLDPDVTQLLPPGTPSVVEVERLRSRFGGVGYVVLLVEGGSVEARRAYADAVAPELARLETVKFVTSADMRFAATSKELLVRVEGS